MQLAIQKEGMHAKAIHQAAAICMNAFMRRQLGRLLHNA
jgi:hypothetical protein